MTELTTEEMQAVYERVSDLEETERVHPGLVINLCNCTNKSSQKYFKKYFRGDTEKAAHCISWLEEHGGFCNCEILFNVLPYLPKYGNGKKENSNGKIPF